MSCQSSNWQVTICRRHYSVVNYLYSFLNTVLLVSNSLLARKGVNLRFTFGAYFVFGIFLIFFRRSQTNVGLYYFPPFLRSKGCACHIDSFPILERVVAIVSPSHHPPIRCFIVPSRLYLLLHQVVSARCPFWNNDTMINCVAFGCFKQFLVVFSCHASHLFDWL